MESLGPRYCCSTQNLCRCIQTHHRPGIGNKQIKYLFKYHRQKHENGGTKTKDGYFDISDGTWKPPFFNKSQGMYDYEY